MCRTRQNKLAISSSSKELAETGLPDTLTDLTTPQLDETSFAAIDHDRLLSPAISTHPPRILSLVTRI
ncbi:hypothetical protein [Rhodosalinus sp. 5P4]|uniref:hypothetical protein n=1 Tax=Rhodosalinus sp. 5P4 TaxID=3239196 RepID=UPI00352476C4